MDVSNLEIINEAMNRLGINAAELARRTGIHNGLIGRYLRGDTAIGIKNAPRIASALELSSSRVLFGDDPSVAA